MKKYLLIYISLVVIIFSCKKDEVDLHKYAGLPDATQSGENTMGCIINGIPWVANIENPDFFWSLNNVEAFYGENRKGQNDYDRYYLDVKCSKIEGKDPKLTNGYRIRETFYLNLRPIANTGLNNLLKNNLNRIEYIIRNENVLAKTYILDTIAPYYLNITNLDTVTNIVSGLFHFRLKEIDDSKDTLRITNGRFDANYWPK